MKESEYEEKFGIAVTIFLCLAFACIFTAIVFFQDDDFLLGGIFTFCSVTSIVISFLTYYNPFYPVLAGMIIYASLLGMLCYSFGDFLFDERSGRRVVSYLFFGLVLIGYALKEGYKEMRKRKEIIKK